MSKKSVRELNQLDILKKIVREPGVSRAEIVNQLSINKATVSEITKKLLDEKIIIETGEGIGKRTGGPKPIQLELNYKMGMRLAIDLGPQKVEVLLAYLNDEVVYESTLELEINQDTVIGVISNIIEHCERLAQNTEKGLIGVAIAIYGVVSNNKIVFTPYYDIQHVDIHEILSNKYALNITLMNEANLLAIAEYAQTGIDYLIALSIHDGIGMGIIDNGIPYLGQRGFSGEIGHTILYPLGRDCPCGNKGCFEQYCSDFAIVREYGILTGKSDVTLQELCLNYKQQEFEAIQIINDFCFNLTIALNDIIMTFAPSSIYLTSQLIDEVPELIEKLSLGLNAKFNKHTPIFRSSLIKNGIAVGALTVALEEYITSLK